MLLSHLNRLCLIAALLLPSAGANAEIYKWVDEHGQTHYSQQAPASGEAVTIDVPLPPPVDTDSVQDEVQQLIEQQRAAEQAELEAQQAQQSEAERQAAIAENCAIARDNLRLYQDNPGSRLVDENGNVYRLTEEERQQKIQESQQQIEEFCQN
jgi:Domain of unknown function (DUF4124)